jgi:hypothetical protein
MSRSLLRVISLLRFGMRLVREALIGLGFRSGPVMLPRVHRPPMNIS